MDAPTPAPRPLRSWRGAVPPDLAEAVRAAAHTTAEHDRVAPLSEQPLLWLSEAPDAIVHLVADVAETNGPRDLALIGYAQVDLRDPGTASAELFVLPGHRRRGTGTTLLAGVRTAAGTAGADHVSVWAHGDPPGARAFAAHHGLAVVRELLLLRAVLADRPAGDAAPLPTGVTVRPFVPGRDEAAWVEVNARAFVDHPEQGRLAIADLVAREGEDWFDPAGLLLAERDGRLLAAVWTKVHPAGAYGPDPVGEIYALGVHPDAQRLGVGRALSRLALDHLAERHLTEAVLYTEATNEPALRTYTWAGFHRDAADVAYDVSVR